MIPNRRITPTLLPLPLEPDYVSCRSWLLNYGAEIGLQLVVDKEYVVGKPVLVFKLEGGEPHIPAGDSTATCPSRPPPQKPSFFASPIACSLLPIFLASKESFNN